MPSDVVCLAKAQRASSAPALCLSGEAQVFLHLVCQSGAKGSCSTPHRGKPCSFSARLSLLLLLPLLLLLLLLWLLLCCSARTLYL